MASAHGSKQTTRQTLMHIRAAQQVRDRERMLKQKYEQTYDATQHYPGPEIMGIMILVAGLALLVSLCFGVVSVAVIYAPAVILVSVTIIVLRQIAGLPFQSHWRRACLLMCFVTSHVVLLLCVVPLVDMGFAISYRVQETPATQSTKMRALVHLFRHYLFGDVCVLILGIGCTVYALLGCVLCYATRGPIYTSYPVIDLTRLDKSLK